MAADGAAPCRRTGAPAPVRLTRGYGRISAMCLQLNAREVRECGAVGADDRARGSPSSGGDDQVVRPARSSLASDMNEQLGVDRGDRTVVVEHGDGRQDVVKEGEAGRSLLSRGQEYTDTQLRRRYCGDRYSVVVAEGFVEVD